MPQDLAARAFEAIIKCRMKESMDVTILPQPTELERYIDKLWRPAGNALNEGIGVKNYPSSSSVCPCIKYTTNNYLQLIKSQ